MKLVGILEGEEIRNTELVQSVGTGNGWGGRWRERGGGVTIRYTQGCSVSAGEVER